MANITLPGSPTNGQTVVIGNKVFVYSNATGTWASTRLVYTGILPVDTEDTAPTVSITLDSVALAVGSTTDLNYIITEQDGDIIVSRIATSGMEDANVVLYSTNNTISITAGSTDITNGSVTITVSDGINTATDSANVSFSATLPYSFQGSNFGYVMGGDLPPETNRIDKFPFSSDTNATDVADLNVAQGTSAGHSSSTHGYSSGGTVSGVISDVIQKFQFSTDSNATDVGDLTQLATAVAGSSSADNGYASGVPDPARPAPPVFLSDINKFPFASDTNATGGQYLSIQHNFAAGQSSNTHGYTTGGSPPSPAPLNLIDKFPFATDTNATDIGDLAFGKRSQAGQSSSDNGYATGGALPPAGDNQIQKFPFASDTNATDIGNLFQARWSLAGQSSTTDGYTSGGLAGAPISRRDTIDKFPFASDTNATNVGNLTQLVNGGAGVQYLN